MNEHSVEYGKKVNLIKLKSKLMPLDDYVKAHSQLVIACHDVAINYNGGILLIERKQYPLKDALSVIGGRINRGMPIIDSLKAKVKAECGLYINNIVELGVSRSFWSTDPFGHGRGTDTIAVMYYAVGKGELVTDETNINPVIVKPSDYTKEFRSRLHPYIQEILDKAIPLIEQ